MAESSLSAPLPSPCKLHAWPQLPHVRKNPSRNPCSHGCSCPMQRGPAKPVLLFPALIGLGTLWLISPSSPSTQSEVSCWRFANELAMSNEYVLCLPQRSLGRALCSPLRIETPNADVSHDTSTPTHWTPLARPFGGLDTQKPQKWHLELGRHDSFWCWGGLELGS